MNNIETELKYRVNNIPSKYDKKIGIAQTYFNGLKRKDLLDKIFPNIDIDTINTFRTIIKYDNKSNYIVTLKTKSEDNYSRLEYEKEISKEEYDLLNNDNIYSIIIKNRYIINYDKYKFEFDEYLNLKTNLITVEVELDSSDLNIINEEKIKIESILKDHFNLEYLDVTKDYRYKNSNLQLYF